MIFLPQFKQINESFVDNTIAAEHVIYKVHGFFSLVVEFVILACGAHLWRLAYCNSKLTILVSEGHLLARHQAYQSGNEHSLPMQELLQVHVFGYARLYMI